MTHLHECFPDSCRDKSGVQCTDERHVDCEVCRKNIDKGKVINVIPSTNLEVINNAIHRELVRSVVKHGMWDDEAYLDMYVITMAEFGEAHHAMCIQDHNGEHGTFAELAQTAACCQKMMNQILEREGK